MKDNQNTNHKSRRSFMRDSAALAGGAIISPFASKVSPYINVDNTIKIALIGCGGRGTGAADQVLNTGDDIRLVAMAEPFKERLDYSYKNLLERHGKTKVAVKDKNKFTDLQDYKAAMELADVVLLATPPGFRPIHLEEAVNQGKHIFMEKPVATDVPGVRKVLELAKKAKEKKLKVLVGHHLRFQKSCIETIKRLQDGIIGDLLTTRAYFNSTGVWVRERKPGMTEMEYQIWNWYYFNWLCGDHIVEQHVHDMDLMNWIKGSHPVKAQGMGGRQVRTGKEFGQIFDHHFVEYYYPDGSIFNSQCRHIKGCWDNWSDAGHGTRGTFEMIPGKKDSFIYDSKGKLLWKYLGKDDPAPHQVEQTEFFRMIREDEYINQAESGAMSTMTAILGRMATYTGQMITWDEAMKSEENLLPEKLSLDAKPLVKPDKDGNYPIPMPGITKFI
ncbi:Gfo/Idh/MocA family protein [Bacteroidota bacterium]